MRIHSVAVGSDNPVKIRAVSHALEPFLHSVQVNGIEVTSGVSSQPMSDEETSRGALQRATQARLILDSEVGIGLEGGVFILDGEMWNTVWCCAIRADGDFELVNGCRFRLPDVISKEIIKGAEMGIVMEKLTGQKDIRKKMGMIGVVSSGMSSREDEYSHLVKLAVGRLISTWR